ncbi:MAG: hydroxyisourate hydrolase [Sphingomonas taxi]
MTLSTHVLDTVHGTPAAAIPLRLIHGDAVLFAGETDADGRCPALRALALHPGRYRLSFTIADYFRARGVPLADPPFLDIVTIDFGIADEAAHHHVPLLVSPFAYSTYRGS